MPDVDSAIPLPAAEGARRKPLSINTITADQRRSSRTAPSPSPSSSHPSPSPRRAGHLDSPSIELLPPSPTRSLSLSSDSGSDAGSPPSRLAEIARICVGRATLKSKSKSKSRSPRSASPSQPQPHPQSQSQSQFQFHSHPHSSLAHPQPRDSPMSATSTTSTATASTTLSPALSEGSRWWPRVRSPRSPRIVMSVGQHEQEPFASDVAIRGWQVVGGKSFSGGGKVGAYVVYDIEIHLRSGTSVSILRRYTEFVRLRDDLRHAFPHLRKTIPALPGKNHMSKFSEEFLEDRRPRLQRFLRTVMLHPEMGVGGDESVLGLWVLKKG